MGRENSYLQLPFGSHEGATLSGLVKTNSWGVECSAGDTRCRSKGACLSEEVAKKSFCLLVRLTVPRRTLVS